MEKIVVASTNKSAGKTSICAGVMEAAGKKFGYLKPLGDRLVYSRKRLWDHDAAYMSDEFTKSENPEDLTLGFEHGKLRYMYDKKTVRKKIIEMAAKAAKGKDAVLIEGGSELWHGASVNLDAISVSNFLGAKLVLVVDGDDFDVMDDIFFMDNYLDTSGVKFAGIIINKIKDLEDFRETYGAELRKMHVNVLGMIPKIEGLTYYSARYLADRIFAKNLTGETGINKEIKNIYVGDISASAALTNTSFKKEDKLVITSGDRSDMIIAALESSTSCIVLTNNILPHANIISKAIEAQIPILSVAQDTYQTATQIERMEVLLTKEDREKTALLGEMMKKHLKLKELIK
jgi:uncharacterized protein